MMKWQERATAHAAAKRIQKLVAENGRWSTGCTDNLMVVLEFTAPRSSWWRFW